MDQNESILPVLMEDEMKSSYLDYSMSVIVSRALPDIRDGLKPVHRRILYAMSELGMDPSKPHKKSARLVGEVLGKYHPHGDGAVYDAMVRLAQPWSMRYPLVDGQGNFGSIDGDPPAAMRYTEVRLARPALDVLRDIDKGTVDFRGNFDDSLEEPTVLPTVLPTLLVNGAGGIAVGMATNIPPHNLRDISRGIKAIVENPDVDIDELIKIVKAPDFPTGGTIYGYSGVIDAYKTGRGKVVIRAKSIVETTKTGKETIVITEIPYQVNKSTLIEKIAFLVRSKVIEGIADIRDESDRDGMRLVIDLKRDANPQVLLNNLYKHTQLQQTFGVIMLALQNGRPKIFNLKEMMKAYIDFRVNVIVRRSMFELDVAEKRAHILEGFLKVFGGAELAGVKQVAEDRVDQIVQTIKSAANVKEASEKLQTQFDLSEIQAKAVLELRLQRLTAMERDKIVEEYNKLRETIARLNFILATPSEQLRIAMEELDEVVHKFGDERRTDISFDAHDMSLEDMIENEDVIITVSREGLIKRTPTKTYRTQNRGGRGVLGAGTHEEDSVEHMFYAKTHDYLMFFTDRGRCYRIKIYDLPEGSRTAKGRSLANVIQKDPDEKVTAFLAIKEFVDDHFIFFTTQKGKVKRVRLSEFESVRVTGKIAISLDDDDKLLAVNLTNGSSHIIIGTRNGMACHFKEKGVRTMGRTAAGVRGIRLAKDDIVVAMVVVNDPEKEQILVVAELGYGKRSPIIVADDDVSDGDSEDIIEETIETTDESTSDGDGEEEMEVDNRKFVFRLTNRGGKGVRSMKVTEKTGKVVSMLPANDDLDLIVISENGIIIRQEMKKINIIGRNTQGVRLIRLDAGDRISDITTILHEDEEEIIDEANVVETTIPSSETTEQPTQNVENDDNSVSE